MDKKRLIYLSLSLLLLTLAACKFLLTEQVKSQQPNLPDQAMNPEKANLVALFFLRQDHLKNQLRGEIYPIALFSQGKYVDASINVRRQTDPPPEIERVRRKLGLSDFKRFTLLNQGQKLAEFRVNEITSSQFQCSELLTGKGQISGERSLINIFKTISPRHSSSGSGYINGKKFDETLKWAIAISDYNQTQAVMPEATQQNEARFKQDLLAIAQPLFLKFQPRTQSDQHQENAVLEEITILDLDHDQRPEVFGKVRQVIKARTKLEPDRVAYLSLWLTYKNAQPWRIADLTSLQGQASWGTGYDLVGIADITGDGTEEVVIRSSGYESEAFEIYEYRENKLIRVFQGAGFGC